MDAFAYSDSGVLSVDGIGLDAIAERHGTPCYVYAADAIEASYREFTQAFARHPHQVCYAVKANSNLSVLAVLAQLGAGFDIVSGGELARVLRAGGDPARTVFSGVAKSTIELEQALSAGIGCFNVESAGELERLEAVAAGWGRPAPVSIRVNPDVDPLTHPYISTGLEENKFGVPMHAAQALYRRAADSAHLEVRGVDCHIGSQLTTLAPVIDALGRLLELVDALAADGIELAHVDLGGGLGVRYRDEAPPTLQAYADAVLATLDDRALTLVFEPGRRIVAEAGVLLTRVEYLKQSAGAQGPRRFAVVDAGMNDLLRPALYDAWHDIDPVRRTTAPVCECCEVVGPVCETADFLGRERAIDARPGELLAVRTAGAYGFGMASNYNSRARPPEVMVRHGRERLVRRRETIEAQIEPELAALSWGSEP